MTKAAIPAFALVELLDDLEPYLLDRNEDHLCDALGRLHVVSL